METFALRNLSFSYPEQEITGAKIVCEKIPYCLLKTAKDCATIQPVYIFANDPSFFRKWNGVRVPASRSL